MFTLFRRVLIAATFVTIIASHLYCFVQREEWWPASPHPMFTRPHGHHVRSLVAEGFTNDGEVVTLRIGTHLQPFDRIRLMRCLQIVREESPDQMQTAMGALLDLYHRNGERGDHDGPALMGLRMTSKIWRIKSGADNIDSPTSSDVVAVYRRGRSGS